MKANTRTRLVERDIYCRECNVSVYRCDEFRDDADKCCDDCSHYVALVVVSCGESA